MSQETQLHNDYKHMTIIHADSKPKTEVFLVQTKNRDIDLGLVKWYAPWRQYCFMPDDDCVFSKGCMADINDFIEKLMEMRKNKN